MISLIEINLSQECGTCSLCGASLVGLGNRQYGVGILQIVDNLLPALVVGVFRVRKVVVVLFRHVGLVHEWNLLEQALQLEVSVSTQELHLGSTLLDGGVLLIGAGQNVERQTYAAQIIVETCPNRAERPVGSHHASALFQAVEWFTIREVGTAYVCIVRACIIVPERERSVHVFDRNQSGVC